MTQLEKEALVFFKDYTHLQLKSFKVAYFEENRGKAGGATEPYELQLLEKALEYHSYYTNIKLKDGKRERS